MEGYARVAGWMSDMGWSTIASLARPPNPGSAVVSVGFSQSPLAGRVHRSIMWAKLRTLAEGAAIASKMAWG